jgi:hypothetical protein
VIRLYVATTLALLAFQACGSARSTPGSTPDPPAPDDVGSSATVASAGRTAPATGSAARGEPQHPSDQECDALFAHALAVEQAQRPADQQLGEPELATVRAKLRERKMPACLQLSRATYRCMLAAPTLPALTTCS